jgi:hypothetical protein
MSMSIVATVRNLLAGSPRSVLKVANGKSSQRKRHRIRQHKQCLRSVRGMEKVERECSRSLPSRGVRVSSSVPPQITIPKSKSVARSL